MANLTTNIPSLKLNDGASIPMLGYGTGTAWYKRGEESKLDQAVVDAVRQAIKLEYTHLDCAEMYKTESEVGKAIKESGVEREQLFVTTKCSKDMDDIEGSLRASLQKLQLDYVDLYLIHRPFFAERDEQLQSTWAIMEKMREKGLTKSIGVSNYFPKHLSALLSTAKVVPACNQIEFHPYLQNPGLLDLHKKHSIATVAYGPLSAITRAKPDPIDDFMAALAKKYAVSEAEICIRWCIDQDVVPITTSSKEQRLSDYLRATAFKLTPMEIKEINELGQRKSYRGFWTAEVEAMEGSA